MSGHKILELCLFCLPSYTGRGGGCTGRLPDRDSQLPPPVSMPIRTTVYCLLMPHSMFVQQLVTEATHMWPCRKHAPGSMLHVSHASPHVIERMTLNTPVDWRETGEQPRQTLFLMEVMEEGTSVCIHWVFPTSQTAQSVTHRGQTVKMEK